MIRAASLLFVGVFSVYLVSPIATPADSRWTIHTALSLIHERNADLNEYAAELEAQRWCATECLPLRCSVGPRLHDALVVHGQSGLANASVLDVPAPHRNLRLPRPLGLE